MTPLQKMIIIDHIFRDIQSIYFRYPRDIFVDALKLIINPTRGYMKKKAKGKKKVEKVMKEFKKGELHSGSKKGPKVTKPKQAIAIALSEAKKAKK